MSPFLEHLVARSRGSVPRLEPRRPSPYEAIPAAAETEPTWSASPALVSSPPPQGSPRPRSPSPATPNPGAPTPAPLVAAPSLSASAMLSRRLEASSATSLKSPAPPTLPSRPDAPPAAAQPALTSAIPLMSASPLASQSSAAAFLEPTATSLPPPSVVPGPVVPGPAVSSQQGSETPPPAPPQTAAALLTPPPVLSPTSRWPATPGEAPGQPPLLWSEARLPNRSDEADRTSPPRPERNAEPRRQPAPIEVVIGTIEIIAEAPPSPPSPPPAVARPRGLSLDEFLDGTARR